ncbi:unnamed protein product [Orchesella dallaii]|uniref:Uncharacterized protein n=1 Tax=Orchesella dallaii TaxID=48710 RepID=A0ABP1Q4C4_9HEXA
MTGIIFAFLQFFAGSLVAVTSQAPPMIGAIFNLFGAQVGTSQRILASSSEFSAFHKCEPERQRSIYYKFSVEGFDLSLPAGSCIPQNREVRWKKISFEGDVSQISIDDKLIYNITKRNDLVLKKAQSDLATYYSVWLLGQDEILSTVWTVEIVRTQNLEQVKARSWGRSLLYDGQSLEIAVKWGEWSQCSRCDGIAGRRHKFGFCSVKIKAWDGLEMLATYKQSVSCSLLINLRPDYLADKLGAAVTEEDHEELHRLTHALGKPPLIMLGFCRQSTCAQEEGGSNLEVVKSYPYQFQRKYYGGRWNAMPNADDNDDEESEVSSSSWIWLMKGLIHGVPFGWDNVPEIIALISLILLQLYILKLVWWNKNDAK